MNARTEPLYPDLPVKPYLSKITTELATHKTLILTAETGAGKSTLVPIALQSAFNGTIVMLEPRRTATVAVALRISAILREPCGQTAGYAIRGESRISAKTRISVVTQALLARRMIDDPFLEGVSAVILDEFHERSIHGDTALAFLLDIREARPDLCILIMSATVNSTRIAAFLNCPVFSVPGKCFPVTIEYRPVPYSNGKIPYASWATICCEALHIGSVLFFMPGIREIRFLAAALLELGIPDTQIQILHGSISADEQRAVLTPREDGSARVIIASAVAETSLTVPDIIVVIDSGLSRINRFVPATGMDTLATVQVTAASATQRTGRAGRTAPGRCIRLWNEHEHLIPETLPEIERSGLIALVLQCAQRGITDPAMLRWLDPPPAGAWNQARDVLLLLEAITKDGIITPRGLCMLKMPCDPRISAAAIADYSAGCMNAASLDLLLRSNRNGENGNILDLIHTVDDAKMAESFRHVVMQSDVPHLQDRMCSVAVSLATGFIDRIARRNSDDTYTLYSGKNGRLNPSLAKILPDYLVVIDGDAGEREFRISLYIPLTVSQAENLMRPYITESSLLIRESGGSFQMKRTASFGGMLLWEKNIPFDRSLLGNAYVASIQKDGIASLPWTDTSIDVRNRLRFFAYHSGNMAERTKFDDSVLCETAMEWLLPFVTGSSKEPLSSENLTQALMSYAGATVMSRLKTVVPTHYTVMSGNSKKIDYSNPEMPVLAVKIQEMFGCTESPLIMNVPVLLHLLSPSMQPLQITCDLQHFWQTSWHDVVKEMRGVILSILGQMIRIRFRQLQKQKNNWSVKNETANNYPCCG